MDSDDRERESLRQVSHWAPPETRYSTMSGAFIELLSALITR